MLVAKGSPKSNVSMAVISCIGEGLGVEKARWTRDPRQSKGRLFVRIRMKIQCARKEIKRDLVRFNCNIKMNQDRKIYNESNHVHDTYSTHLVYGWGEGASEVFEYQSLCRRESC